VRPRNCIKGRVRPEKERGEKDVERGEASIQGEKGHLRKKGAWGKQQLKGGIARSGPIPGTGASKGGRIKLTTGSGGLGVLRTWVGEKRPRRGERGIGDLGNPPEGGASKG